MSKRVVEIDVQCHGQFSHIAATGNDCLTEFGLTQIGDIFSSILRPNLGEERYVEIFCADRHPCFETATIMKHMNFGSKFIVHQLQRNWLFGRQIAHDELAEYQSAQERLRRYQLEESKMPFVSEWMQWAPECSANWKQSMEEGLAQIARQHAREQELPVRLYVAGMNPHAVLATTTPEETQLLWNAGIIRYTIEVDDEIVDIVDTHTIYAGEMQS